MEGSVKNPDLKYRYLRNFEKDMITAAKKYRVIGAWDKQLLVHNGDNVLAYQKGNATFAFNFDPCRSYPGYFLPVAEAGEYCVVMSTDDGCYGGHERVSHQTYTAAEQPDGRIGFQIYLPCRSAIVLRKINKRRKEEK